MSKVTKYLVMLGVGHDRKARAARFDMADEATVRRVAGLLNFRVGVAKGDAAFTQAGKLPEGNLSQSSFEMVPIIAEDKLYRLFTLLTFDAAWTLSGIIPGRPQVTDTAILEAAEKLWDGIAVNSVVLHFDGSDGEAFGWSACVVLAKNGQTLELRYRDWPGFKPFLANARSVGLLHPDLCP